MSITQSLNNLPPKTRRIVLTITAIALVIGVSFFVTNLTERKASRVPRANKPEVMAFDVPQTVAGDEPPSQFLTSVRAIEKKSQLDFMWELPDDVENKVETQKTGKVWDN